MGIKSRNEIVIASVPSQCGRNYELDFLKLIFALIVFIYHSQIFVGENTRIEFPPHLGKVSVHFFFVVTGMLMANSTAQQKIDIQKAGKVSIDFVLRKFKAIAGSYFVAMIFGFVINVGKLENIPLRLARIFPEMFSVYASGVWINNNFPTWYLSAMFISMLPLVYLLYKKADFTLYILAPLFSITSLGYMCQTENYEFLDHTVLYGIIMGGFIRALCGLCFGICAFTITVKLRECVKKARRVIITVLEILLYSVFFGAWFLLKDNKAIMSVVLLLPIALAITFSGMSYVAKLFRFSWMRRFSSLSLSIFLNHGAARYLTVKLFDGESYKKCLLFMVIFTTIFCVLNHVIVKLFNLLWTKKLKLIF